MLLNLPIILSGDFLNPPIILKIIPTRIDLLTIIHANLLINLTKRELYTVTITTLNRHKTLSTAKDFLNCSHRNKKYLIVGLKLDQGRSITAWKAEQQP